MGSWQEYFELLEQVGASLDRLAATAREKTAAVMHKDVATVEDCMRREQAMGLALRSLDQRREKMLAALGLEGVPLSGLAGRCPPELRLQAKEAAERLRRRYEAYRAASDVARTTLECNLHQIEKALREEPDGIPPGGPIADFRA